MIPEPGVVLYSAGRTDTGVHALGQIVSFQTESRLPIDRWAIALNSLLPRDISVASVDEAHLGFHARFSAVSRSYLYLAWTRRTRSAIWDRYSMHVRRPLDVTAMQSAADHLIGTHDFAAFAKAGGQPGPTTVRSLTRLRVRKRANGLLTVCVTANGFLRAMVRNIVGVLLEVGVGDLVPADAGTILASRDRAQNPCAPALPKGLCLWRVDYPVDEEATEI